MATFRKSVLGASVAPNGSNKVTLEPYSRLATNDFWKHLIIRIDEDGTNSAQLTTRAGFYFTFTVPQNYVGSPKIFIVWTATVTTGDAVFDVDYRAVGGDDAESLDQATAQESLTVTDAAPSAAHERNTPSVSLTAANLAAGDTVEMFVGCDGTDGADTLAAARIIHDVIFEYADS